MLEQVEKCKVLPVVEPNRFNLERVVVCQKPRPTVIGKDYLSVEFKNTHFQYIFIPMDMKHLEKVYDVNQADGWLELFENRRHVPLNINPKVGIPMFFSLN